MIRNRDGKIITLSDEAKELMRDWQIFSEWEWKWSLERNEKWTKEIEEDKEKRFTDETKKAMIQKNNEYREIAKEVINYIHNYEIIYEKRLFAINQK